jgi:hypothetical protein
MDCNYRGDNRKKRGKNERRTSCFVFFGVLVGFCGAATWIAVAAVAGLGGDEGVARGGVGFGGVTCVGD